MENHQCPFFSDREFSSPFLMPWTSATGRGAFFRVEELKGGVRVEQGAAAGRLRVVPVGEENEGVAPDPQLEQLPPALGARPGGLPLQQRRGHPGSSQRLDPLVAGVWSAHHVLERPDGGSAHQGPNAQILYQQFLCCARLF
jgi:hypothetical protein